MSAVTEIEAVVKNLPEMEFERIVFVVLERLRQIGSLPPPRKFTEAQVRVWIEEDEKDMAALLARQ